MAFTFLSRAHGRRRCLNISLGVAFLIVLVVTFALGFSASQHSSLFLQGAESRAGGSGRMLELSLELDDINTDAETMSLDWQVIDRQCVLQASSCTDVMLFFDSNQLTGSVSNTLLTQPTFYFNATSYNATVFAPFDTSPANLPALLSSAPKNSPIFKTTFTLQSLRPRTRYPFDAYFTSASLSALDATTNKSVSLKIDHGVGVAIGFLLNAVELNNVNNRDTHIAILFTVERWNTIKVYGLTVAIALWAISMVFLAMTIKTVAFRYPQRGEVLLAPAASLFAFTSLRSTLPGNPPFGIFLDNFASLPCLCILAFSAAFTAGVYVVCDPTTMEIRVKERRPRDVAVERYTETLFEGGEAIAYNAEANQTAASADASTTEDAWKLESAKHKAVAAALRAVAAARKTVDAAMDVTHSSFGKTWRNDLKVAEMKILVASAMGATKEDGKMVNIADPARDVIDVARRAAEAAAARYSVTHPEETLPTAL